MPFSKEIRDRVLIEAARHCSVCNRYGGVKVEVHHIVPEATSHDNSYENAICLCFDCHCDAGHYNDKHPKGTKFSPSELKGHRERWKRIVAEQNIPLKPDASNMLHVQYYVCTRHQIMKDICERKLNKFPAERAVLYENDVLRYQAEIAYVLAMTESWVGHKYDNESEFLKAHPDARHEGNNYPSFRWSRAYKPEYDSPLLSKRQQQLFGYYLQSGLRYEHFVTAHAYREDGNECGGSSGSETVMEYLHVKFPFAFYACITNIHDRRISISQVTYYRTNPANVEHVSFPPNVLEPGASIVLPIGQFLEHVFDHSQDEEVGGSIHEGVLTTYRNPYPKEAIFFGPKWNIKSVSWKYSSDSFTIAPHTFDPNNVFYVDEVWAMGSCPHCFLKTPDGEYSYFGELLTAGQNSSTVSEFQLERDVEEMLIAEIEDETTYLESVEVNGCHVLENVRLEKGQSVSVLSLRKGDHIIVKGYYVPYADTSVNVETLFRRNSLVAGHLRVINAHDKKAPSTPV